MTEKLFSITLPGVDVAQSAEAHRVCISFRVTLGRLDALAPEIVDYSILRRSDFSSSGKFLSRMNLFRIIP